MVMDNYILKQRYQYHEIEPYRDFCKLEEKPQMTIKSKVDIDFEGDVDLHIFSDSLGESLKVPISNHLHLEEKGARTKKNTKYFYSGLPSGMETISIYPYRQKYNTFYTTKDATLIRHFGRPLSQVATHIHERTIKMDDDVLAVRVNHYTKSRFVNCKFFKRTSHASGFSFNLKTGNIIIYEGMKKTMSIRQNNFERLLQLVGQLLRTRKNCITFRFNSSENDTHPINVEFNEAFDQDEFKKTLYHAVASKLPANSLTEKQFGGSNNFGDFIYHGLLEIFVTQNGIKVPNNYAELIRCWYPTKKYLKKNENKLIAAILDRIGLKSKSILKLLHARPDLEIGKLILLAKFFGFNNVHKYIHNLSPKFFDAWVYFPGGLETFYSLINNHFEYDIRDTEKKVLLKLINSFFNGIEGEITRNKANEFDFIRSQFNQFTDHLDMIIKIRKHLPDIEFKASSIKDFHTEHIEISKIERSIKKGYSIEYKFEEKLIEEIEEPIYPRINIGSEGAPVYGTDMDGTPVFYPVILKIDGQYSEEGKHMHHCVATYADRERSVIVSIREGSPEGAERVTCEFDSRDKSCVQAKYFCNAIPPEKFEYAIEKLKHRIKTYRGSIKSISKEKVPLVINGKTIEIAERESDHFLQLINDYNGF